MQIHPETLKTRRAQSRLSQEALAERSGVSKKTLSRIESGKVVKGIRAVTVERIAKTLGVRPEELVQSPANNSDREGLMRDAGYRKLRTYIDGPTALAYALVRHRYNVMPQSLIDVAPVLFTLLAEGSLAWRREKVAQIKKAASELSDLGDPGSHLCFTLATWRIEEGCRAEEASINQCDLFGAKVGEDAVELGYDQSTHNPFASYLRELAAKYDPEIVELDPSGPEHWKTDEGMPEYRICAGDFSAITGEDYWAEFALERGHVRISDIPSELAGEAATSARIAWLASHIPPEVRQKQETFISRPCGRIRD